MAKILFLQNLWYEYMGVMWISAVLKKHSHSCDVLISDKYKEIRDKIIKLRPDVIGFSCMSGMFNWAKKISQRIKKEFDVIILIGGPHATYFPAIIEKNKDIDVICRGEGEYAILDLMNAIDGEKDSTKIENLWVRKNRKIYKNELRPLISDLDQLPFPDRTIYFKYKFFRKNPTKNFMTARGCPYNCKFCYNHTLKKIYKGKGTYVRYRSPENIVNEILEIKKKYGIKTVYFYDDTFIMDRKWINELMNMYKERVKLPFIAQIRADFVDEALIKNSVSAAAKSSILGLKQAMSS